MNQRELHVVFLRDFNNFRACLYPSYHEKYTKIKGTVFIKLSKRDVFPIEVSHNILYIGAEPIPDNCPRKVVNPAIL